MTDPRLHTIYLSLGSNVGDREHQLREAIRRLATVGTISAVSSFYETEPVEFTEQPWFMNVAAKFESSLSAAALMSEILSIEQGMGRRRVQKKGPRTIDIDILLFGDDVLQSEAVTVPHPAMQARRFVLEPLAEIAPDAVHPVLHKTIRELRDALGNDQQVRRVNISA